jgi:hypothetical protein
MRMERRISFFVDIRADRGKRLSRMPVPSFQADQTSNTSSQSPDGLLFTPSSHEERSIHCTHFGMRNRLVAGGTGDQAAKRWRR